MIRSGHLRAPKQAVHGRARYFVGDVVGERGGRPDRKLASPCRRSATRRLVSATAIAGNVSAGISQERRYALARDAELFGDFLHSHSLAVQRERLCPADTGTDLIQRLRCLGDQLDAEIPLRRFDYLPVGPPG
jgi:hypothetical protein